MNKPITTTLNAMHDFFPSEEWKILLKHLGKTEANDEPLKFSTIAEMNVTVAYRCLMTLPKECRPAIYKLTADVAERVLPIFENRYPNDTRPREAIAALRGYALGKVTREYAEAKSEAAAQAGEGVKARECELHQDFPYGMCYGSSPKESSAAFAAAAARSIHGMYKHPCHSAAYAAFCAARAARDTLWRFTWEILMPPVWQAGKVWSSSICKEYSSKAVWDSARVACDAVAKCEGIVHSELLRKYFG